MTNAEMVDTIEADTVDAVDNKQENQPAGGSQAKTFTADEVDAKIKARIDKQNAKHAEEIASLNQRLAELEARAKDAETSRDELQHQQELSALTSQVAREYGLPAEILRGQSIDELREHAAAIKASISTAPVIRDSGASHEPPKTTKALFNKFMNENFN